MEVIYAGLHQTPEQVLATALGAEKIDAIEQDLPRCSERATANARPMPDPAPGRPQ